jgi:hypothetical protein
VCNAPAPSDRELTHALPSAPPHTHTNKQTRYFIPREGDGELLPLGISLFLRANRDEKTGEDRGTFAVISHVDPDGIVAASGTGHDMIWPEDRIVRVQARDLSTLPQHEFLSFMKCRRLQLVVCNVDEYAAATRDPDFMDDLGRQFGAAKVRHTSHVALLSLTRS